MNISIGIGEDRLPEGLLAQMEPGLIENRPPSVASSGTNHDDEDFAGHDNDEFAGEEWVEIVDMFQTQEEDFVEQDERAQSGLLFDTPATPAVKRPSTPKSPTISLRPQSAVSSPVCGSPHSPSVTPLKPPLRPLSTMWPTVSDLKGDYHPHVSRPLLPVLPPSASQDASATDQSATSFARESPSSRFFASSDQIHKLGMQRAWIQGQVISTLGDTFCHTARSKPRPKRYEVLPTDLLELWKLSIGGQIASRTSLSVYFNHAASPFECRAWLVPVLLIDHWYLLIFDWIDHEVRIYDSLSTSKVPPRLVEFGRALLSLIEKEFQLGNCDWNIVPQMVGGFHRSLAKF